MLKTVNRNFIFALLLCLIGGALDAYSFLYNDGMFCLIQTGNLIRVIISLVDSSFLLAGYSFMLFFSFLIALFLINILNRIIKNKNYEYVCLVLVALFLIIPFSTNFDLENIFNYQNILSGISLSIVGAIIYETFKEKNGIPFSSTMITANSRRMTENLVDGIYEKNKDKRKKALFYFFFIISFALGVLIVALLHRYIYEFSKYILFPIIYLAIILMFLILIFEKKKKSLKS